MVQLGAAGLSAQRALRVGRDRDLSAGGAVLLPLDAVDPTDTAVSGCAPREDDRGDTLTHDLDVPTFPRGPLGRVQRTAGPRRAATVRMTVGMLPNTRLIPGLASFQEMSPKRTLGVPKPPLMWDKSRCDYGFAELGGRMSSIHYDCETGVAPRIRVFVLADARLYRESLTQAIASCGCMEVVGTARVDRDGVDRAAAADPEIVLIDGAALRCTDGLSGLLRKTNKTKLVALGVVNEEGEVIACAEKGMDGYVPAEASALDLAATIRAVAAGEFRCPPRIAAAIVRRLGARAGEGLEFGQEPGLTLREKEVLALVDQGLCNKEIAGCLHIQIPTVKNHVHNILSKLHTHHRGRAAATFRAMARVRSIP